MGDVPVPDRSLIRSERVWPRPIVNGRPAETVLLAPLRHVRAESRI